MKVFDYFSFFSGINSLNFLNSDSQLLEVEVRKICSSSKEIVHGSIFCAYKGVNSDGHQYIAEAIAQGAIALVVEDKTRLPKDCPIPVLLVPDARSVFEQLCAVFFHHQDQQLYMIGVTGTNGKTSITYLTEFLFQKRNIPIGVMGTVNHRIGHQVWETSLTTPDSWTLHERLHQFREQQAKAVVMEVSSHALHQKRVNSLHFDAAIFTNLSRDHLDYHKTMQEYFKAKQVLFYEQMWKSNKLNKMAIINGDDRFARKIETPPSVEKIFFGKKSQNDFVFKILKSDFSGQWVELKQGKKKLKFHVPLIGEHSIYNLIPVMILGLKNGISLEESAKIFDQFPGVPGRLQRIENKDGKHIFVDYAHSPDALENVLSALLKVKKDLKSKGDILTLFGCGGDRDKGKRPLMGAIAQKFSQKVIITSDNPRTEKPEAIIKDILKGIKRTKKEVLVEVQRELAIEKAISQMKKEDVLILCGKGHEDYQIIGTEKKHFSDVEEVQKYFNRG